MLLWWQVSCWTWSSTRVVNSDFPVSNYLSARSSLPFLDTDSWNSGCHACNSKCPSPRCHLPSNLSHSNLKTRKMSLNEGEYSAFKFSQTSEHREMLLTVWWGRGGLCSPPEQQSSTASQPRVLSLPDSGLYPALSLSVKQRHLEVAFTSHTSKHRASWRLGSWPSLTRSEPVCLKTHEVSVDCVREEWNFVICGKWWSWDRFVKWRKPVSERQTLHSSSFSFF